ncbi:MAG: carbon-nitrogen hydrolase family protein [Gemmatimonadaceae bacterium]|nr:carbon-nitrogen hydrolase family protein [Gemmatimonadaceae bacterium]
MRKIPVAIVQAAPVPLAVGPGIEKAVLLASQAIAGGAELVAFGETFLGGYPIWLDEAPGAALWNHRGTRALHRIMIEQAVTASDLRLAPLQQLCDDHRALISIGAHERLRSSLYNCQFLFRPGQLPLLHRKLVPTHGERLIWARGDGSTIDVHRADWGNAGQLICWEHWMPLARAAMHNLGEAVHIASWPTVREVHALASRHYAFEGRCFVLAAGLVQHRDDLFEGLTLAGGDPEAKALLDKIGADVLNRGGSMIIGPDARVIAAAGDGEETIHALLDLGEIGEARAALDVDGHYSRPDIFSLHIDRDPKDGVSWS